MENGVKRKVLPSYSRADLPIHAKTGREWAPTNARSLYGRQDDGSFKAKFEAVHGERSGFACKGGILRFWAGRGTLYKSLKGRDLDKESTRIQC